MHGVIRDNNQAEKDCFSVRANLVKKAQLEKHEYLEERILSCIPVQSACIPGLFSYRLINPYAVIPCLKKNVR